MLLLRYGEMEPMAVNSPPVPAQLERLVNLDSPPNFVVIMGDSNQPVQTCDYYASNQQISQIAAINRDHVKISLRSIRRSE